MSRSRRRMKCVRRLLLGNDRFPIRPQRRSVRSRSEQLRSRRHMNWDSWSSSDTGVFRVGWRREGRTTEIVRFGGDEAWGDVGVALFRCGGVRRRTGIVDAGGGGGGRRGGRGGGGGGGGWDGASIEGRREDGSLVDRDGRGGFLSVLNRIRRGGRIPGGWRRGSVMGVGG